MRREMMNYRKIRRNIKAVSPVISVLLMIVVAVAASLVTYAWVMGYMGFTTNKVGKAIVIQSVSQDAAYVQNVGDSKVTLASFYVNGVLDGTASMSPLDLNPSDTATITPSTTASWAGATNVTVKVVTTDGTFAEFTKTFP
jgi:FlaG/FlaF family flagellin (archaellin)